jgi:ubiquinone/menaquinone biosynthesis C-methylase UbiE
MSEKIFDEYAEKYDSWFLKNKAVLESEVALLAYFLRNPGRALSVGCGSGLFEMLLKRDYGIVIEEGIEPAVSMAEIARKRGLKVRIGTAEKSIYGDAEFDTIIFNGSLSYINDLRKALSESFRALKPGGHILVADVPKESSYALLYNLAKAVKTWYHPSLKGVTPEHPYPIEFVRKASWRTTTETIDLLKDFGFKDLEYAQTLTRHPVYSSMKKEKPVKGYDRGDYVAIRGLKPQQ